MCVAGMQFSFQLFRYLCVAELLGIGVILILVFRKFGRHCRVAPGQLLDRYVLGLVVS